MKSSLVFFLKKKKEKEDFPGGPVVKTPRSQCRGHGFNPWWGKIPHAMWCGQKKKKEKASIPET